MLWVCHVLENGDMRLTPVWLPTDIHVHARGAGLQQKGQEVTVPVTLPSALAMEAEAGST